jgi:hypothetical protein
VATEKQIAANRANAKRSTGPKTLAGKIASSRNAYRHGLSGAFQLDSVATAKVDAIAHALAGERAIEDRLTLAADFARAQLGLLRVRATRAGLMEAARLNYSNINKLRRLVALDRYERYCLTKRRRALKKLQRHGDDAETKK